MKILVYLDGWFLHFALSEYLKKNPEYELSAIIDTDDKAKKFFQTQKIIKFQNEWYVRDHIILDKQKPDINYLETFEKKYKINLWSIIYAEKTFYSTNIRHKFNEDEILSLLEKECRLFEQILDKIKPKFLMTMIPVPHYHQLLCAMCKSIGVKIMILSPVRFANRVMISESNLKFDETVDEQKLDNKKKRTDKEIQQYLQNYNPIKQIKQQEKESFNDKKFQRYKAILKFFITNQNFNDKNYYYNYGNSKPKILIEKISRSSGRKYREHFLNNNSNLNPDFDRPFVYYSLHYEPERILLVDAKFYDNQLSVITSIAKSLPIGHFLYVKEHPMMKTIGWRPTSYYKQIIKLANVVLLHHTIPSEKILKKCSLVVTIAGTTGLEAAFYAKPVILLTPQLYSIIPFVHTLKKIDDLPETIRLALQEKPKISDLNDFVELIDRNSFEFNIHHIGADFAYRFGYKGPMMQAKIPELKLKKFLKDYNVDFENLANEHIKKIEWYKKFKN